jgi:hypothetical protein
MEITLYRGWTFTSPKFVGSSPQPYDKVLNQILPWTDEIVSMMKKFYEDQERNVDHGSLILVQLHTALKYIDASHKRRRLYVESLIAEQYYKLELYRQSFQYYKNVTDILTADGWMSLAVPLLYLQLDCAYRLGKLEEMFHALLILYSSEASQHLDIYKKEQLHRDIFFILNAASTVNIVVNGVGDASSLSLEIMGSDLHTSSSSSSYVLNRSLMAVNGTPRTLTPSNSSSYVGVTQRPEYGSAASADDPATYTLPNKCMIHLTQSSSSSPRVDHPAIVSTVAQRIPTSTTSTLPANAVYNPQFFNISVHFHQTSVEIGQSVLLTISILSLCQRSCTFDEIVVTFCGRCLVVTFTHDQSCGLGDSDGGVNITTPAEVSTTENSSPQDVSYKAQLILRPSHLTNFTFPISITEEMLKRIQTCVTLDSILCVNTIDFLSVHQISPPNYENTPSDDLDAAHSQPVENPLSVRHEVVLSIQILPEGVSRSRDSQLSIGSAVSSSSSSSYASGLPSKPWSIREIVMLFNAARDSLLQITKPSARITLVDPIDTVSLLQGPLQRLNVIFSTEDNDLLEAKLYLASDYSQMNDEDFLFWYPDLSSLDEATIHDRETMDAVVFHPLQLNSSFQPSQAFLPPATSQQSHFVFPLFLRSEIVGQVKVRYRIEYIPKSGLRMPISKEFETKVSFVRPLQVNFNLLSHREAQSGVLREAAVSTIMRGDIITVSSSLSCLDSLDASIDVLSLELRPYTDSSAEALNGNEEAARPSDASGFSKLPQFQVISRQSAESSLSSSYNLLLSRELSSTRSANIATASGSIGVTLSTGESYVNSIDVKCIEQDLYPLPSLSSFPASSSGNILSDRIKTSIGNVYISWRTNDPNLLRPFDLSSWLRKTKIATRSVPSANSSSSSWLPDIDRTGSQDDSPVNRSVVVTRLCSMIFSIPALQVIPLLFHTCIMSMADVARPVFRWSRHPSMCQCSRRG